jgi:hypothetical protein
MVEGFPEEFLHHRAVASLVGMGESVARRSGCTAQAAEPTGVVAKGIADIVKAGGVGELGEKQADDMAPSGEGARLFVYAVLLGEAGGKVGRDQLAKLSEDGQVGFSWFVINHPGDPEWDRPPANLKKITVYGMTVNLTLNFSLKTAP